MTATRVPATSISAPPAGHHPGGAQGQERVAGEQHRALSVLQRRKRHGRLLGRGAQEQGCGDHRADDGKEQTQLELRGHARRIRGAP